MSKRPPVVISTTNRGLEVHVAGVPGWAGFDQLMRYLEKHHGASVIAATDGPDARVSTLRVGDVELTLDYEHPFGTTLVSNDPASATLRAIADDLQRRLSSNDRAG